MVKPIAIVGMAFRLPGDMADESQLWKALLEQQDLVSEVPQERWAVKELQHSKRSEPGRSITFSAGVLSRIDEFDAEFFGISPREAAMMDPQQRLLLELAWEAMENGGVVPSSLAGTDCAVYVGISGLDYGTRGLDDMASMSAHSMTGNTLSIAANRLSYVFDLHGPSLAVDTACSSSLVALHHACASLQAGDASCALVGGVNMLLHPYPFVGFTKASMLSADGRCKAFDSAGNGYVRAEGGVALLLKPLDRALADGDTIQAVIAASGINSDGARKTGITIPSSQGQAELMRAVLEKSGLSRDDIDFVEAHGTGTIVGDPIEAAAIGEVYGRGRPAPLPIGSVKANMGHLEPASGLAGLVKTVLALKNRALPPALHLRQPNPHIDFDDLNLELVHEVKPLSRADGQPLTAALNSFGFGGANAHVLLQALPAQNPAPTCVTDKRLPPLFLSAKSEPALKALATRYAELCRNSIPEFRDIAFTAATHRERLEYRLAVEAEQPEQVAALLDAYGQGESSDGIVLEQALPETGKIAFIYSGNGAQWHGMGLSLMAESPRFSQILEELDELIQPYAGFSLSAELRAEADSSRLDDTQVAQPVLFAIQVALTILLKEQGVMPHAVAGHSVGEVAAAWAAGALSLEQAVRVICARSGAQGLTRGSGRMAAVAMSADEMAPIIASLGEASDVAIAGINSPSNITLSGNPEDLKRIQASLVRGTFFRMLDLDYAFHTHHMDAIETDLLERLDGLVPSGTQAVFVSTVTGAPMTGQELDAHYWWRNVREPVRFGDAIAAMAAIGCRTFLEVGPHAILQRYMTESLSGSDAKGKVVPTLRKGDDGAAALQKAALRTHLLSEKLAVNFFFPAGGNLVRLPNYPWQKVRHWHPSTSEGLAILHRKRVHPLLGWALVEAEATWENHLDPQGLPWLADHQVGGAVVFPGAGYVEMALAAAHQWLGKDRLSIEELDIVAPLVFDGEHARALRFILNPRDGGFRIMSRQRLSEDNWILHAAGRILEPVNRESEPAIPAVAKDAASIDHATHYHLADTLGLMYGPAFQAVSHVHVSERVLSADLQPIPSVLAEEGYHVHPALMDACYQSLVDFFRTDIEAGLGVALLPVKVTRVDVYVESIPAYFRARLLRRSARSVLAEFEIFDRENVLIARLSGCRFRAAPLMQTARQKMQAWMTLPVLKPHPIDELATTMPSVADLVERCSLLETDHESRQRWFREKLPLFEALTLAFAHEAITQYVGDDTERLQQLIQSPSAYVAWLVELLKQESLLIQQENGWALVSNLETPPAQQIWQVLLRDAPDCLPQLTLMAHISTRLPDLLSGQLDFADFAHALKRLSASETLFDADAAYQGIRQTLENLLRSIADQWSPHRRLRVLEIGAHASDLPRHLVNILPADQLDYVLAYTEEEAAERARQELQEHAHISVAHLRMPEWKLESEDALSERFDVILVRHVLHLADNPFSVLEKLRSDLAAGGLLVIAERYPDWSADFIAGVAPDWWRTPLASDQETPLGAVSSLLPPQAWQHALREHDFEADACYTEPASEGVTGGAYLVLAKRSADVSSPQATIQPQRWLLLADEASREVASRLLTLLQSHEQIVSMNDAALAQADHVVCMQGWGRPPQEADRVLAGVLTLTQQMSETENGTAKLWTVTQGGALASNLPQTSMVPNPVQAAVWGLGRVVMNELPDVRCTLIDVACQLAPGVLAARLENELIHPDGLDEILLADDARYALELHEEKNSVQTMSQGEARFRLDFRVPGQLRNLLWLPDKSQPLGNHQVEVRTHATGLNFRDVMYLMGLLPDEAVENGFAGASLGLEFSGVVTRVGASVRDFAPGDAVMGFGSSCFSSHVVTRDDALAPLPGAWSFEEAATVPTVFLTVYYSLRHLADLQPGERVLIHGAAGGIGIAAIQLAKHLGAEVYATAGSPEKRDFVRMLGADHVFDSRSLEFAEDVLAATQGEGVDVVLNSLAGEAIRRNLRVLRPFGRFLELGKRDFYENTPLGLRPFKDNISYFGIDADQLLTGRPQLAARMFREVMALFRDGILTPLPYRAFDAERVVDAFRYMQQSRHIGKVIVSLIDAAPAVEVVPVAPQPVSFTAEFTWMVSGGLAGFGLESARWLVDRGVRHLVLISRRGGDTPGTTELIETLEKAGVSVHAKACDVSNADALRDVLKWTQQHLPPLRGVLHAAATFDDRVLANLDRSSIEAVLQPKLKGAWNLHQLTSDIPLEHFILYSSMTTCIGNPGQGNYVAANAGLEGLALLRKRLGLPVTCIGWGPIGDAGYLTRNTAVMDSLGQRLGKPPLVTADALAQLDKWLADAPAMITLANFDWGVLSRLLPSARTSRFNHLNRTQQDAGPGDGELDIQAMIAGKGREEVVDIIRNLVLHELAQTLCMNPERIDPARALHDLGLDSLMAVELALGLEQRFKVQLPVMALNQTPTVDRITGMIVDKLLGTEDSSETDTMAAMVSHLAQQHGEHADEEDIAFVAQQAQTLSESKVRLLP